MFEERLLPLLLCQSLGKLRGKTRFQKLTVIVQHEAMTRNVESSHFKYEKYFYGPYSSGLSDVIDDLKNEDYLNEDAEMTPSGYTMYVYSLTPRGSMLLDAARERHLVSTQLENIVAEVATSFGNLPLNDLVNEAYRRFR